MPPPHKEIIIVPNRLVPLVDPGWCGGIAGTLSRVSILKFYMHLSSGGVAIVWWWACGFSKML